MPAVAIVVADDLVFPRHASNHLCTQNRWPPLIICTEPRFLRRPPAMPTQMRRLIPLGTGPWPELVATLNDQRLGLPFHPPPSKMFIFITKAPGFWFAMKESAPLHVAHQEPGITTQKVGIVRVCCSFHRGPRVPQTIIPPHNMV
jgi:hypothetical protein